jgi:hypothetical protein
MYEPNVGQSQPEKQDEEQGLNNEAGGEQQPGQYPSGSEPANAAPAAPPPEQFQWPPGFAGQLANFIYYSSIRPVREVAVVAALGLLAGVCGRAFTVSGKGLNLYLILVARSGVGKEAMHSGVAKLIDLALVPRSQDFVLHDEFASGPALMKWVLRNPSFVNVLSEFGRKLKRMSNDKDSPMQELRTVLLNLYEKSGAGDKVGGIKYSNGENNVMGAVGVAYSLIGETTPDTFREMLTPEMMADGTLSRFTIVEYTGLRPPPNEACAVELEPDELSKWQALLVRATPYLDSVNIPKRIEVVFGDDETERRMNDFGLRCDNEINSTEDESKRQMWNRAHMKALKIAALLAVADNNIHPVIRAEHAAWARSFVELGNKLMMAHVQNGDIGHGDVTRERKLLDLARKFIKKQPARSYKVTEEMWQKGVIPRAYFQMQVSTNSAFCNHKLGQIAALNMTLGSLVDSGYLMEFPRNDAVKEFGQHGRFFRVLMLPD